MNVLDTVLKKMVDITPYILSKAHDEFADIYELIYDYNESLKSAKLPTVYADDSRFVKTWQNFLTMRATLGPFIEPQQATLLDELQNYTIEQAIAFLVRAIQRGDKQIYFDNVAINDKKPKPKKSPSSAPSTATTTTVSSPSEPKRIDINNPTYRIEMTRLVNFTKTLSGHDAELLAKARISEVTENTIYINCKSKETATEINSSKLLSELKNLFARNVKLEY